MILLYKEAEEKQILGKTLPFQTVCHIIKISFLCHWAGTLLYVNHDIAERILEYG